LGRRWRRQLIDGQEFFLKHQTGGNPLTLAAVSARIKKPRPGLI
jgi:hypothetical protein